MGRVSCADLAELRSAYLDGALRDVDRERVLSHVAGCDNCRAELDELRQVRSMLTHRLTDRTPAELPIRLLAIPEASPRKGPGVPGLAKNAGRIRRRVTAAVATLSLAVLAVAGLGLAAAPAQSLATVADPSSEAAFEFEDVVSRLPMASQLASVLVSAPASEATEPAGRPAATTAGPELSGADLTALLQRAARATAGTSYTGTQEYFTDRDGRRTMAFVAVTNQLGRGLELRAYDSNGQIGSLTRPAQSSTRLGSSAAADSAVDLLTASRTLTARRGASVLDRPAVLVDSRPNAGSDDTLTTRWWIDEATGLVLWQETTDAAGRVMLSTGFTDLTVGATAALEPATTTTEQQGSRTSASLTLSRADDLASAGWACSARLAGLSLVRLRSDAATSPGAVHMVYSDGVDTVSVIEQHGRFDPTGSVWDPDLQAYVRSGGLPSISWQSGESVVTVVSDAPGSVVADVVAALPHERLHDPTTMERVVAGWARILGHR